MTENRLVQLPATAVIGAGLMGHGIAQVFMAAGAEVCVWDPDIATLEAVPRRIADHGISPSVDTSKLRLSPDLTDAVKQADLVIEAIPEQINLKQELLEAVEERAPNAIFATNTSALRITEIAARARFPQQVIGTHWWNPPFLIPLVEVVRGNETTDETTQQVILWLTAIGQHPVEVFKDVPGFVGNRMQFALMREAAHIAAEGIASVETIDRVIKETIGRRWQVMGPLTNADFIGLDLVVSIMDYLSKDLSNTTRAPRIFRELLEDGKLGAKSGEGLYTWTPEKHREAEQMLIDHLQRIRDYKN